MNTLFDDRNSNSEFSKIRVHHTKYGALIRKVIAPSYLEELLDDVKDASYSVIIDESTNISDKKYLFVCFRYFSKVQNKFVTNYLGLIEVQEVTGAELYK